MISIQLSNVKLVLGARTIFENLTWSIQHDQKIGLIGPNGAGKSSIFNLITGVLTPEPGGVIARAKGVTIGYLPQEPPADTEQTAFQAAFNGNPRWNEVNERLHALEEMMGDPKVYGDSKRLTRVLEEQHTYLEEYSALGGESYPARVRELLTGLGLEKANQDKAIALLSGGQKKLVGLAALILSRPSVLLLDEPDNHLDLPGKIFLQNLISNYPGAVVLISHDRYMLDAVVSHITELEDGKLFTFSGDYSNFILDKEERLARQEELFQIQQREINRLEMARKRYALWVQVNDKFASRMHAMENRLARIERLDRPVLERRRMELEIGGWRGSTKVLEIKSVEKSFDDQRILNGVSALIEHGERVGLIGANGAGKSILLRMILELEQPDKGEIRIGPSVRMGYYAQQHETLDPEQTLIDTIRRAGDARQGMSEANAVAFLNRFLFPYPRVVQRVRELSGGERSRLQLALLVLSGANFLLLDEPTNNLDIASAEVLENSLDGFVGTILVISHDRYFLDRTVNRILLLEDGKLTEFVGGYSDFAEKRGLQ